VSIDKPNRIVIEPPRGWVRLQLAELWEHRELLYFLTWRDVKVRYKQTALGALWAVLQPVLTMIVFSIFFSRLGGLQSDNDIPYPVFAYTALLPWQLFSHALMESGNSVVANQNLITKVYFPRLVIPVAPILAGLVDFAIASVVLVLLLLYYGITPGLAILTLPLFVLMSVLTAISAGLWLSALNVQYRDIRYTIPFLTQFWLFLSPVAYSVAIVPERWRALYAINPMVGVVEGFRWALLGKADPPGLTFILSGAVVLLMLVGGLYYFKRMESAFADVV
jgi:lipopolysaccharide transport system permease protein